MGCGEDVNQALNVLSKLKKNWVESVWLGEGIIHDIKNSIGWGWGRVGRESGPQGGGWGADVHQAFNVW